MIHTNKTIPPVALNNRWNASRGHSIVARDFIQESSNFRQQGVRINSHDFLYLNDGESRNCGQQVLLQSERGLLGHTYASRKRAHKTRKGIQEWNLPKVIFGFISQPDLVSVKRKSLGKDLLL